MGDNALGFAVVDDKEDEIQRQSGQFAEKTQKPGNVNESLHPPLSSHPRAVESRARKASANKKHRANENYVRLLLFCLLSICLPFACDWLSFVFISLRFGLQNWRKGLVYGALTMACFSTVGMFAPISAYGPREAMSTTPPSATRLAHLTQLARVVGSGSTSSGSTSSATTAAAAAAVSAGVALAGVAATASAGSNRGRKRKSYRRAKKNIEPVDLEARPKVPKHSPKQVPQHNWTDDERRLVMDAYKTVSGSTTMPDVPESSNQTSSDRVYNRVAEKLRSDYPRIFGHQSDPNVWAVPQGIVRQQVRQQVVKFNKGSRVETRGRNLALSEQTESRVVRVLHAVVGTRLIGWTAALLRPLAIGTIIADGHGDKLRSTDPDVQKQGHFCCSLTYIREITGLRGWRSKGSYGDSRKLPENHADLGRDFVHRLACLVRRYGIPPALVGNWDHTGIMFTPNAGKTGSTKTLKTKEMVESNDTSVAGAGDKRQATAVFGATADFQLTDFQVVVEGKTSQSLPSFRGAVRWIQTGFGIPEKLRKLYKKPQNTRCFVPDPPGSIPGIGSACVTSSHWSDNITSKAIVRDIIVPFFRKRIHALRAGGIACLPFGVQVCICVWDLWWGWLNDEFRCWVRAEFKWLFIVFCPPNCTPVYQPCDLGVIKTGKTLICGMYERLAAMEVTSQLVAGKEPEDVTFDMGAETMKANLMYWVGQTQMSMPRRVIQRAWEKSGLLKAWDPNIQMEAMTRIEELFTNIADPRLSDWAYQELADEALLEPDLSPGLSLSEISAGVSHSLA